MSDLILYHYTCSHGNLAISRDGMVRPLVSILNNSALTVPTSAHFAWFTDLDVPHREALGLTSNILNCDRTEHRFRVTDRSGMARWIDIRRLRPDLWHLEDAPGAMPQHWWVATEPVPVVASLQRLGGCTRRRPQRRTQVGGFRGSREPVRGRRKTPEPRRPDVRGGRSVTEICDFCPMTACETRAYQGTPRPPKEAN